MPIYSLKEFQHIMATDNRISGLRGYRTWIDEFDEMYEKYEREGKLMSKGNEYIFKVKDQTEVDIERIARENPCNEMILVISDGTDGIVIMVDDHFNTMRHIIDCGHTWHEGSYICRRALKANIQNYIDAYNKAKAEPKPKPKQTVRVKTFGDTLPF
jgi:hypothetical protein